MGKQKTIELSVITPERTVVHEQADSVVLTAHDGELGVLADRAPLMCELGVGTLRYRCGSDQKSVFIDGGFAQVHQNKVTILTPDAATGSEATEERIAAADRAVAELRAAPTAQPAERARAARRAIAIRRVRPRAE